MVELEAGQRWRPTRGIPAARERVILRAAGGWVTWRTPSGRRLMGQEAYWPHWVKRHGARLVTDDGAGGEG